jgi:hypothetical protein
MPALPLAPSDTLAALKDLYSNGLIDMNKLKTSAFLTPEAYATSHLKNADYVQGQGASR